jgi:hypothetical protein
MMMLIRTQVNEVLEHGVIEESQASEWSQAHPVPKGDGQYP